ncbi:YoaK family protein [Nonomuraea phyllanthi]|uniref:YoaK family protein n=1 Tax=Nonomuraea phyllanthi TaxID=2219224 RepID=UPI001D008110|nr:YoaK family protein [Nonomuraea phyllanthi]
MKPGLRWVADELFPRGNPHGVLPVLLILLAMVTGFVDAVSFLGLGHVFVANMTGNIVFLGFALAGSQEIMIWAPALALACFAAGAWSAGLLARRMGNARLAFAVTAAAHTLLVVAAVAVALAAGHDATGPRASLIGVLAYGMGLQNASVRALGVPDLVTNVLTTTLTGLAADAPGRAAFRRAVSVVAMLLGGLAGAALFLTVGPAPPLGAAAALLAIVAVIAFRRCRRG